MKKMKTTILKVFQKNILLKTKIFCSNSDEEYYVEECRNLFLETLKKQEKNISFFKLGTLKFPPEM